MSILGGEEMELGKQIKKHRQEVQLSQEKLADRVYVSRQTISNWENDKSYPDVNSLVLLSEIFQISLDNLIKGDIEVMKDVIQKEEIVKMNRYGKIYTIMLIVTVVSAVPLFMWLGVWAFIPWGIIWALSMYFAFQVEKVKKDNDVQTYKEIVAFSEGKLLDDIQKQREIGKRPYQKIFLVIGSALITFVVCVLIGFLMHIFMN
ncbi:DNA-binding helix-turn-helix protein [Clostridium sp. L2-50]|jgi:transcriptional regulator with XRE-family HTH domain|nr:DNA-binding helix-turn-helix protein [Clostridium sp. L2-50]